MKKILFSIFLISFPLALSAKEQYVLQSTENVLTLSGVCSIDVKFVLTPVSDTKQSVYSSGTSCKEGEFSFSDDLSQWNIPDGQYTLWVNGEPAEKRIVMKKIVVVPASQTAPKEKNQPPRNTFEQAVSDFGNNLVQMSRSLGVMEENLPQTDYTKDTVKRTLIGFLRTTLDTLASFFGDFTSESTKVRPSEVDVTSPDVILPDVTSETIPQDNVENILPSPETVPTENVVPEEVVPPVIDAPASEQKTDIPPALPTDTSFVQ